MLSPNATLAQWTVALNVGVSTFAWMMAAELPMSRNRSARLITIVASAITPYDLGGNRRARTVTPISCASTLTLCDSRIQRTFEAADAMIVTPLMRFERNRKCGLNRSIAKLGLD